MKNGQLELSEMQFDLLKELFNLGIGAAANSLSQLVNQEVLLSVPDIIFETPEQLANRLGAGQDVFSVSQSMEGSFAMHSMIIFNPEDSFDVVKQMLDQHLSDETLAELQSEALSEIGNIVLNSCISVIAEALGESFAIQPPIFRDTKTEHLLDESMDSKDGLLISILVKMELKNSAVNGHLVFILNADSMENLYKTLNSVLEGYC
jgi:chemotaxis protein CheC